MKRHFGLLLAVVIVFSVLGVATQQPQPAPPSTPARPAAQARAGTPPPAPAPPAPPASAGGQSVNIRLDVTISDQSGAAPAQPKTLTMLIADRNSSQIRSTFEDRSIRMDATPTIIDTKIRLSLTMESQRGTQNLPNILNWSQFMTVIVENGKALVVLENSDPANNRKLSVEVKATIQK